MADTPISSLQSGSSTLTQSDIIPVVQDGTTKYIYISDIVALNGVISSYGYTDLTAAHTAASSAGKALFIETNLNLTENLSTTVPIIVSPVGSITQTASYVLTIGAGFVADDSQVFIDFLYDQVLGLKEANVVWFGAKQDSTTDCYNAFMCAIHASQDVFVPNDGNGYYRVASPIAIESYISIHGPIGNRPQIYNDTSGTEAVFTITGNDVLRKTDISIKYLDIRNGTSTTGTYTSSKNCITINYANNIYIDHCRFPDTQGPYVIVHKYTENINITWCHFTQWTHAAIASFVESKRTLIQHNYFGTALTEEGSQHYATMTGNDTLSEGTFGVNDYKVLDNYYYYDSSIGSSRWHAINSHGGENIWIERNRIYNYIAGINIAGPASGYWSNGVMKNVWIKDNIVDRGDAAGTPAGVCNGILVNGEDWDRDGNFFIEENYVKGMGYASPVCASILAGYGRNIRINRNTIQDWITIGIYLQKAFIGGEVKGNTFIDDKGTGTSYTIYANVGGLYGIDIDYNRSFATEADYIPTYGIYRSSTYAGNVIIGQHNDLQASSSSVSTFFNWIRTTEPTDGYWKHGDELYGEYGSGQKLFTCQAPGDNGYYGYLKTAQTCTGSTGEYYVTLDNTALYYEIPQGSWVTIANAASGPSTLTTQVLSSNFDTGVLILKDALGADITSQAIAMVAPTWRYHSYLSRILATVSTSGTGEDSLASITLKGGTLNSKDAIIIKVAGTITGGAGDHTIKVKFGSTEITTYPASNATDDWYAEVYVYPANSTSAQRIQHRGYSGTTLVAQGYDTAAEDTTADVTISVTGECSNAGDTISRTMFMVEPI